MSILKDENPSAQILLRRRAEDRLDAKASECRPLHSETDAQRLVHELEVHQIELEMQNEELRRAQEELELSHDQYIDLYDFAPTAYLTFDEKGLILKLNLNAAKLLGIERISLVNKPFPSFIQQEHQDRFYLHMQNVLKSPAKQTCELVIKNKDGIPFDIQLESIAVTAAGQKVVWAALTDVTERKQVEQEREKLISELQKALSEVKTLSGLLPICATCKKIRDDKGYWNQIELYIGEHSDAQFSHGICPECAKKFYLELHKK